MSCVCMMQVRLRDPAGFIEQLPERDFQLRILSAYYTSPALLHFFSEQLVWPQALQESALVPDPSAAAGAALGGQPVERQLVMPERSPERDGAAPGKPSSAGMEGSQPQPASAPASHQTSGECVQLMGKEGNPEVVQQQPGAVAASATAAELGHSDMELDSNAGTPQQGLCWARVSLAGQSDMELDSNAGTPQQGLRVAQVSLAAAAAAAPGAEGPAPAAAGRPTPVGSRPGSNPSLPGTGVHLVMQGPAMVASTPSDAEYCQALSLLISAAARGDQAAGREVMQRVLAVFNMWGARLASHPTTSAPDAGPLRSLMKMVQVGTNTTQTAL